MLGGCPAQPSCRQEAYRRERSAHTKLIRPAGQGEVPRAPFGPRHGVAWRARIVVCELIESFADRIFALSQPKNFTAKAAKIACLRLPVALTTQTGGRQGWALRFKRNV